MLPQACIFFAFLFLLSLSSCSRTSSTTIAVIPRTTGTGLWEPEHGGVMGAAIPLGVRVYWNAPTREDDIQGQIAMVERIASGSYQGLILAPDHALALVTPVRRAVSRGLPTVIIGSPLDMPPGGRLSYVLNDEQSGGRIAGQRVAEMLHGKGTIAVLGIDPAISGVMERARSLEQFLAENDPEILVVANQPGSFNVPHEQQVAEETLRSHPDLDAIVALTSTATHGALSAIESSSSKHVRVIGFDPDSVVFNSPNLDCFIVEDLRKMGAESVQIIVAELHGRRVPAVTRFEPVLVTRENLNTATIQNLVSTDWRPAPIRWKWSIGR